VHRRPTVSRTQDARLQILTVVCKTHADL
jgi:hypothetical protein